MGVRDVPVAASQALGFPEYLRTVIQALYVCFSKNLDA